MGVAALDSSLSIDPRSRQTSHIKQLTAEQRYEKPCTGFGDPDTTSCNLRDNHYVFICTRSNSHLRALAKLLWWAWCSKYTLGICRRGSLEQSLMTTWWALSWSLIFLAVIHHAHHQRAARSPLRGAGKNLQWVLNLCTLVCDYKGVDNKGATPLRFLTYKMNVVMLHVYYGRKREREKLGSAGLEACWINQFLGCGIELCILCTRSVIK